MVKHLVCVLQAAAEVRADAADRLTELGKQLSKEMADMAKLKANCAGLQKKVTAVQDKIDNAGGEPLRKQKEKVASMQVCSIHPGIKLLSKSRLLSGAVTSRIGTCVTHQFSGDYLM